jgi:hypothetical protein
MAVVRDKNGRIAGGALNPGGRPKLVAKLRERALKAVDETVLEAWIDECEMKERTFKVGGVEITKECRGNDWVRCSQLLAEYGMGKPVQALEHSGPDGGAVPGLVVTFVGAAVAHKE